MDTSEIAVLIQLGLFWIGFHWLYRDYLVDRMRHRLFRLRNELFDAATTGKLEFSDKAYGMLRTSINGSIRFGHRIDIVDCLLSYWRFRRPEAKEGVKRYHGEWNKAVDQLPPEAQDLIRTLRGRFHYTLVGHVIRSSILMSCAFVSLALTVGLVIFIVGFCRGTRIALARLMRRILGDEFVNRLGDQLDSSATEEMKIIA